MKEENELDVFDNTITEEELLATARRSLLFLSACVDGEIADAKVADPRHTRTPGLRGKSASPVR